MYKHDKNWRKSGASLFSFHFRESYGTQRFVASAVAGHGAIPTALLLEHSFPPVKSAIEMQIPAQ